MYENITPEKFYKNMRIIMKEKNISSSQVIRKLKLGDNTFYRWVEYFPRVEKIMQIADYLGVSVDEFLIGKDGKINGEHYISRWEYI